MHEFFRWLQEDLGATADAESWAQQFRGSLNLWGLTEGTHVLTLMVFAGTIWLVDLRLLGLAFRGTPVSKLNERVLPLTMISFVVMVATGVALFLAKPMDYYHNIWFRAKLVFLLAAAVNIFWYHYRVQRTQDAWDASPSPPAAVKLSGAVSLVAWAVVIILGRFIAYNWYECGKPMPGAIYVLAECASTSAVAVQQDGGEQPPDPADEAPQPQGEQ